MKHKLAVRLLISASVVLILLVVVSMASAVDEETVTIVTPPFETDQELVWTSSQGDDYVMGVYPTFNIYEGMTFTWEPDPYENIDFEHVAYQVSLHQWYPWSILWDDPPYEGHDLYLSYHWASNPNHTSFTIPVIYTWEAWVCMYCPTQVRVAPMTFEHYLDESTGVWEYRYTPIPNATIQWSETFFFRAKPIPGEPGSLPWWWYW
jgi:hypothetical protein